MIVPTLRSAFPNESCSPIIFFNGILLDPKLGTAPKWPYFTPLDMYIFWLIVLSMVEFSVTLEQMLFLYQSTTEAGTSEGFYLNTV